jgi:GTP-binding protein Era
MTQETFFKSIRLTKRNNIMSPMTSFQNFKSGFAVIAGAPNAGKSTLLNRMLGQKVSITSKKPQTTRNRILGVVHRPNAQIVFIDTPGIHKAKKPLNIRIVDTALSALADVDIALVVADAAKPDPDSEAYILKKLRSNRKPVILALNKIDLVEKVKLLDMISSWSQAYPFETIIPVSAKNGEQVDVLVENMENILPEGPPFFPEETLTDLPERFIAAEMVREKVFRFTGEEIPYATAVTIDTFDENPAKKIVKINATIHVERNSQKGIIIGKKGSRLKQIGQAARQDIERLLGTRVYLELFIRVQKNWSRDTKALRRFGY